jgi:hypothetical protein
LLPSPVDSAYCDGGKVYDRHMTAGDSGGFFNAIFENLDPHGLVACEIRAIMACLAAGRFFMRKN